LLQKGVLTECQDESEKGKEAWFRGDWEHWCDLGELSGNDLFIVPPDNMPVCESPYPKHEE